VKLWWWCCGGGDGDGGGDGATLVCVVLVRVAPLYIYYNVKIL